MPRFGTTKDYGNLGRGTGGSSGVGGASAGLQTIGSKGFNSRSGNGNSGGSGKSGALHSLKLGSISKGSAGKIEDASFGSRAGDTDMLTGAKGMVALGQGARSSYELDRGGAGAGDGFSSHDGSSTNSVVSPAIVGNQSERRIKVTMDIVQDTEAVKKGAQRDNDDGRYGPFGDGKVHNIGRKGSKK